MFGLDLNLPSGLDFTFTSPSVSHVVSTQLYRLTKKLDSILSYFFDGYVGGCQIIVSNRGRDYLENCAKTINFDWQDKLNEGLVDERCAKTWYFMLLHSMEKFDHHFDYL